MALVASLKSAADFTAALTATLPVLEQLLASSAAAEVQVRRAAEAGSSSRACPACGLFGELLLCVVDHLNNEFS